MFDWTDYYMTAILLYGCFVLFIFCIMFIYKFKMQCNLDWPFSFTDTAYGNHSIYIQFSKTNYIKQ